MVLEQRHGVWFSGLATRFNHTLAESFSIHAWQMQDIFRCSFGSLSITLLGIGVVIHQQFFASATLQALDSLHNGQFCSLASIGLFPHSL